MARIAAADIERPVIASFSSASTPSRPASTLHSLRAYAVYFVGAENLKWNLPGRSHVARISGIVEFAPRTKCHTRPP
jgi:hypothetical protein